MDDLQDIVPRMRAAWMAGRSALSHCPPDWRELVGEGVEGDTVLAALVGHATEIAFRPMPAVPLRPRGFLPRLAAPSLPDALRPRVRRLLGARKAAAVPVVPLLMLLAARGFAMHPADWLPGPREEWAPDLYAPWLDWANAEAPAVSDTDLSLETYDGLPFAQRRAALARLRRADPAAARAIIAAKAPAEPAERRARLIELLHDRLSEADRALLETLTADRSERVRAVARDYLARLGTVDDDGTRAAELAEMVELATVGFLKRHRVLTIKPVKPGPRKARMTELFGIVSLAGFAKALGVADSRLVEAAPEGDPAGVAAFIGMAARTGSADIARALLECLLAAGTAPNAQLPLLAERLSDADRRALLPAVLTRDDQIFDVSLAFAGPGLGVVEMSTLAGSPGWSALSETIRASIDGDEAARVKADGALRRSLVNLGFLLTAGAARAVIGIRVAAGMSVADPKLELLHLNAALTPETSS